MIYETIAKLKKTDERIRILKLQIADAQGIRGRMSPGISSSYIGRPTEIRAIRLAELEDVLSCSFREQEQLRKTLDKEKMSHGDELTWKLIWDHFYFGYSWKETAVKHQMKESAVKMRYKRFHDKELTIRKTSAA